METEAIHVMFYIEVYVVALGPSVYLFYNSRENPGNLLCAMHTSQSYGNEENMILIVVT